MIDCAVIGTGISGTEAGNGFYSAHVPKLFIHEEYNTAIIENILINEVDPFKICFIIILLILISISRSI